MLELKHLTKKFGDFTAVRDLSFTVGTGGFFGLLGPNGAGKTTTIGMISTVLLPTAGEVLLDGRPLTRTDPVPRRKLSVVTQEYSMRQDMTVDEVLEYQARLYFLPKEAWRKKAEELLQFAELSEFRDRRVRKLSGGMKRKLMVCRALLTEPELLILDEPTAGMDAIARRQMWNLLRRLNRENMTILLTTHYMEEAEALCQRVALLSHGEKKEEDSPRNLIRALGEYAVDVPAPGGTESRFFSGRGEAIRFLETAAAGAALRQTRLEDVFVELGRRGKR